MKDFMDFGAVGDGVADDTAEIVAALASGSPLEFTGHGRSYGISTQVQLPPGAYIEDATFVLLTPGMYGLVTNPAGSFELVRVKVDRGTSKATGTLVTSALFFASAIGVTLTDCEIYGDGLGTGIKFIGCSEIRIVRAWIHDMTWQSASTPVIEGIHGIRFDGCFDVQMEDCLIENLLVDIVDIATTSTMQSSGIEFSNCRDVSWSDGIVRRVAEGCDISGSNPQGSNWNERIWIFNSVFEDCFAYGVKSVYKNIDSGAVGCKVIRSGGPSYYVGGSNDPLVDVACDNMKFDACLAIDPGASLTWTAQPTCGWFFIAGSVDPPYNVMCTNCSAISRMSNCTISIASPGVVTRAAHGKVANDPVFFQTTGALPTGLTRNLRVYVKTVIPAVPPTDPSNAFTVSATPGGAEINTSGTQSGTHQVNIPAMEHGFWATAGAGNVHLLGTIVQGASISDYLGFATDTTANKVST